jgi:secreted trypsin-like serine protease
MKKVTNSIWISTCLFVLSSCGGGGSSSTSLPSNYAGPNSCLANRSLEIEPFIRSNSTTTTQKNLTFTPQFFQTNKIKYLQEGNEDPSFQFINKIVGGETVASTTNCQSPTTTPSAKNIVNNNTVALILRQNGSSSSILCSGTVVANNLILTAAHCFDGVDLNSTSPGVVDFGSTYGNPSNQIAISCWQRNSNYVSCSTNSTAGCVLNDIAWVKIASPLPSPYAPISILANPNGFTSLGNNISTGEKLFAGYGLLNQNVSNSTGSKYCVSTSGNSNYTGVDYLPANAITTFNSSTSSGAYQNYLTVIGPITGTSPNPNSSVSTTISAKGTCLGDSGGPVYSTKSGSWILAALTQGSNNILSPVPTQTTPPYTTFDTSTYASCQYGYGVYTTVGNYVNWIQSTSGVTVSTQ